jgi:hypothetical protein
VERDCRVPGIAAIITSLIFQKNLRHIGWKWGKSRYQLLSIFLPIIYAVVSYSVVWLVGWGRINKDFSVDIVQFLWKLRHRLNPIRIR